MAKEIYCFNCPHMKLRYSYRYRHTITYCMLGKWPKLFYFLKAGTIAGRRKPGSCQMPNPPQVFHTLESSTMRGRKKLDNNQTQDVLKQIEVNINTISNIIYWHCESIKHNSGPTRFDIEWDNYLDNEVSMLHRVESDLAYAKKKQG